MAGERNRTEKERNFHKAIAKATRNELIYKMICENIHLSVEQVMAELDISRSTVFRDYAKIRRSQVQCTIRKHRHGQYSKKKFLSRIFCVSL